jgi:hypothetical protein
LEETRAEPLQEAHLKILQAIFYRIEGLVQLVERFVIDPSKVELREIGRELPRPRRWPSSS